MGSVSETSSLKLYSSNYESNFGSILPFQKSLVTMHRNNSGENGQIMSTAKKLAVVVGWVLGSPVDWLGTC